MVKIPSFDAKHVGNIYMYAFVVRLPAQRDAKCFPGGFVDVADPFLALLKVT